MGRTLIDLYNDQVLVYGLNKVYDWWDEVTDAAVLQDWIFIVLAVLYGVVSVVALRCIGCGSGKFGIKLMSKQTPVQLIRIQLRVPEYGWTTQKVFHLLNVLVNGVRCFIFVFHHDVQQLKPEIIQHVLLDVPSLAFFTTYALLVLFWAEIYYQARAVSTDGLRPTFYAINGIIYAIQVFFFMEEGNKFFKDLMRVLFDFVRLFLMLKRFPVESKGRRKKLHEVGYVTTICFVCFLIRCIMMCFNAFDEAANLDMMEHPILNFIYYLLVEILPSSLVLIILRKLPSKRAVTPYHPIQ
ncbi:hypothetical protein M8C21_005922 [Ambrosia artemisiifolia]|uniref:THH1/TOM1/TOM3 domain-containing protein n=1 Tax=Ambrosia artemisiifolia TaxID=4212 RepID=A0AAD5GN01_AMBAR|nr:hypothetical protein M8C21_005922 [Ambrosia artemisiifolia]